MHVHGSVHRNRGSIPVCLSGIDFDPIGVSAISVLDRQRLATHDHGYPIEWIDVPGRGHAGFQNQPPDQGCTALADGLAIHVDTSMRVVRVYAAEGTQVTGAPTVARQVKSA